MKALKIQAAIVAVTTGILTTLAQQPPAATNQAPPTAEAPAVAQPAVPVATPPAVEKPAAPQPAITTAANATPTEASENSIRMNFRGVALETVLDYLSKAAGFIILPLVKVEGTVNVWNDKPMSKEEAVQLLNTILNKNGYAAIRNDRILTIVKVEDAKTQDIPVRTLKASEDPTVAIPKNDQIVTQIIPVRYADAAQLTRDLQPLLPTYATLTANVSGNSLVLTDTQSSIRRMAEIVRALDTSISSISAIRVFPLRFADAKELATVVKELFDTSAAQRGQGGRGGGGGGIGGLAQQFFNQAGGGGGFPGGGGGRGGGGGGGGFPGGGGGRGGGGGGGGASEARQAASRVVAVADERSNSLIVSAPDEYIPTIEKLVEEIDKTVDDVTELRVFHLKNSSPVDLADQLMELFPDNSRSGSGNQGNPGLQFNPGGGRGGFGGGGRGGGGGAQQTSERMMKMGKVIAVPDERTSSLIVSASRELMEQIAQMIAQIDANPAKKQKVFVYSLENADPANVETILRSMFEGQNNRNRTTGNNNQNNQNNPLNNRNQFNQGRGATGGGNNAFGGQRSQ